MADRAESGSSAVGDRGALDPSHARMSSPGVRFPPPFLFLAGFLSGLAIERWIWRTRLPLDVLRPLVVIAAWLGIGAGLLIVGWGIITFVRHGTAIIPHQPASRLVQSGPYAFSRNPMYVGLTSLYVGLALLFNLLWPIVILPLVLVALFYLVIQREERYLTEAFGESYVPYRRRVRRWL